MNYELDDLDRRLLAKCREALQFLRNGDPMKDVMNEDDFQEAVELLVKIVDAAGEPLAQAYYCPASHWDGLQTIAFSLRESGFERLAKLSLEAHGRLTAGVGRPDSHPKAPSGTGGGEQR